MNTASANITRWGLILTFTASLACGRAQLLPLIITNAAEARVQGAALAQEILAQRPAENANISGMLTLRAGQRKLAEIPVRFETVLTPTNWLAVYETSGNPTQSQRFVAVHPGDQAAAVPPAGEEIWKPFAGSDFWLVDLGLEFFQWPEQRLIRKEISRTRSCRVLESINPQPATNRYSKVLTWTDRESLGIVYAEAYDAQGQKLKEFWPKGMRKVDDRWQLQEMEMRNVQTGSRSRIEFDLKDGGAAR